VNKKNASMFQPPGTLYVYPIHAKHCLNVVTEEAGRGAAVLVRALEPLEGHLRMSELRRLSAHDSAVTFDRPQPGKQLPTEFKLKSSVGLTSGPARLSQALAIDRSHDGLDLLTSDQVWIEEDEQFASQNSPIRCATRIGVSQAADLALRWFLDGHLFVSGMVREHSRGKHWTFRHR
jgi:DNA-3-methyladenine glycosylase